MINAIDIDNLTAPDIIARLIQDGIDNYGDKYAYVGLRICDHNIAVGKTMPASHVWDDGNYTDEMLDGASATHCDDAALIRMRRCGGVNIYVGKYYYYVVGDYCVYGADTGEIIMRDPTIVAKGKLNWID